MVGEHDQAGCAFLELVLGTEGWCADGFSHSPSCGSAPLLFPLPPPLQGILNHYQKNHLQDVFGFLNWPQSKEVEMSSKRSLSFFWEVFPCESSVALPSTKLKLSLNTTQSWGLTKSLFSANVLEIPWMFSRPAPALGSDTSARSPFQSPLHFAAAWTRNGHLGMASPPQGLRGSGE